jgi:transcriptional regulator with XRE-family HTH domain
VRYPGHYRWPRQPRLKFALLEDGRPIAEICRIADLSQTTVSGVCTGRTRATENVRRRLADALGRPETELFDDVDVEVSA